MARRVRVDLHGFHHIVNRGVARNDIYRCDEDKEKLLEIIMRFSLAVIPMHISI